MAGFDKLMKTNNQNNSHLIHFLRKGYNKTGNVLHAHFTILGLDFKYDVPEIQNT